MPVELLIKKGNECLDSRDFLGAIANFSDAISENNNAFQAYLKRSVAYQKLHNYENAKSDISKAFTIAQERGKREDIGLCYFKLGLVYYLEKDLKLALNNFNKAKEFGCSEPTLSMWLAKAEYDIKKNISDKEEKVGSNDVVSAKTETTILKDKPSTSIDVINKHSPMSIKIRDDWYQTNDYVVITIYAKNVDKAKVNIQFHTNSVNVSFPSSNNSEYNYNLDPLFGEINVEASSFRVYGTKLEIELAKRDKFKWASLELPKNEKVAAVKENSANVVSYPTSSKKAVDWSNFNLKDEDEKEDENDFFSKLYKDVDDDTKRAMMKSYVESNGTVLTTNWDEAKDKKFETSPPEGMVPKTWN